MTRIGRASFAFLLVACSATLSGMYTSSHSAGALPVDYRADPALNLLASQAADNLADLLSSTPGYFESAITPQGLEISVTPAASDSAISNITSAAGAVPLHIRTVTNSAQDLAAASLSVANDEPYWTSQGVDLVQWGPDYNSDLLDVRVATYSQRVTDLMFQRYGSIVHVEPSDYNHPKRDSRTSDSDPWWGGDVIKATTGLGNSNCTSGFTVMTTTGGSYSTTDRHCFAGTGSGSIPGEVRSPAGLDMGPITNSQFINNGELDFAVIRASSIGNTVQRFVYTGIASPVYRYVSTVEYEEAVGTLVCTDGGQTQEHCGAYTDEINQCLEFNFSIVTCALTTAYDGGNTISREGDSGGPVYSVGTSGAVEARGEIIGNLETTNNQDVGVAFTPMRIIDNLFGVSPIY